MPYHTTDDMLVKTTAAVLTQLTDETGTGSYDTDLLASVAGCAADIIDGYLVTRYTLPLVNPPGILREISLTLALYELYGRHRREDMPPNVQTEYKGAIENLEMIRDGKVHLFETDKQQLFQTNKTDDDRIWPKDTLDTY